MNYFVHSFIGIWEPKQLSDLYLELRVQKFSGLYEFSYYDYTLPSHLLQNSISEKVTLAFYKDGREFRIF